MSPTATLAKVRSAWITAPFLKVAVEIPVVTADPTVVSAIGTQEVAFELHLKNATLSSLQLVEVPGNDALNTTVDPDVVLTLCGEA